jgi:hypothetical protein
MDYRRVRGFCSRGTVLVRSAQTFWVRMGRRGFRLVQKRVIFVGLHFIQSSIDGSARVDLISEN